MGGIQSRHLRHVVRRWSRHDACLIIREDVLENGRDRGALPHLRLDPGGIEHETLRPRRWWDREALRLLALGDSDWTGLWRPYAEGVDVTIELRCFEPE